MKEVLIMKLGQLMIGRLWYGLMNHRLHCSLQTAEFISEELQNKSMIRSACFPQSSTGAGSVMIWAAISWYSAGPIITASMAGLLQMNISTFLTMKCLL